MESDSAIVRAVLGGRRSAYAALVERYQRAVHVVAVHVVGDVHTAEDVAQEAFLTAYERLGSLRSGAAFEPWLPIKFYTFDDRTYCLIAMPD